MASEMVERVARAICSQDCLCSERRNEPCVEQDGSNAPCRATRDMLILSTRWDMAEAAIKAMREPTEAMRKVCSFETAEVEYPAMIDEALK